MCWIFQCQRKILSKILHGLTFHFRNRISIHRDNKERKEGFAESSKIESSNQPKIHRQRRQGFRQPRRSIDCTTASEYCKSKTRSQAGNCKWAIDRYFADSPLFNRMMAVSGDNCPFWLGEFCHEPTKPDKYKQHNDSSCRVGIRLSNCQYDVVD